MHLFVLPLAAAEVGVLNLGETRLHDDRGRFEPVTPTTPNAFPFRARTSSEAPVAEITP
jgi:hypothetical protein